MTSLIDPVKYDKVVKKLREFFTSRGWIEVHTQNRLSILAACEDPETIATYEYNGKVWPLPQTGQMWLEYETLKAEYQNPTNTKGFFCVSTSYRQEPNPVEGRHEVIFPMFEFETAHPQYCVLDENDSADKENGFVKFREFLYELCRHFDIPETMNNTINYMHYALNRYPDHKEPELTNEDESLIPFGMLTQFPEYSAPFWNMSRATFRQLDPFWNSRGTDGDTYLYDGSNKIDVILNGIETMGCAMRSTDPNQMRESFYTISDGKYAQLLFDKFGKERVEQELNEFLSLPFVPRFGGGIGITRLISALDAMEKNGWNRDTELGFNWDYDRQKKINWLEEQKNIIGLDDFGNRIPDFVGPS